MKTLTPGTKIRLAPWNHVTCATFNTVRKTSVEYGITAEEGIERALRLGHEIAFATHGGSCISSSPAYFERDKADAAAAVTVYDGEVVAVEGEPEYYRVRVMKGNLDHPRNSDPIHFEVVESYLADSYAQEVDKIDGRPVTRGELAAVLELVADKRGWKYPIDATVALTELQLKLMDISIPFFCGGSVEMAPTGKRQADFQGGAAIYRVTAAGYYACIGA